MHLILETVSYFQKGGFVMWPLLFCSLTVFAVAIERFLYYRQTDAGRAFASEYCRLLNETGVRDASAAAGARRAESARLLSDTVRRTKTAQELTELLESELDLLAARLKDRLDYLGLIVTLSPLLGLLGTILGMIGSFSVFELQAGAPLAITGGIGEALIATATGLCVAILALCFHAYFTHRMDTILAGTERCAAALVRAAKRGEPV